MYPKLYSNTALNIILLLLVIVLLSMDLTYEYLPKSDEILNNYSIRAPGNNTECMVCMCIDETYERANLVCGHSYHVRCLKKWIDTRNCLNCTLCGVIPEKRKNAYCAVCNGHYGHYTEECGDLHGLDKCITDKIKYRITTSGVYKPCRLQNKVNK